MSLRKGFTLVELLVVVAIIGILVLVAVPRFSSMTDGARISAVEANHRILVSAITMYMAEHNGQLPPDMNAINSYLSEPVTNGSPPNSTYAWSGTVLTSGITDIASFNDLVFTP